MKLINRYISRTLFSAIVLVVVLLAGMELFIIFLKQVGDIGRGEFTMLHAFHYSLMQVPYQIYLFFPVASLLGTLIGLSVLSQHSELIVMRASGVSLLQITRSVIQTALVLLFAVTLLGETVVPKLIHYSEIKKESQLSSGQALHTQEGLWVRIGKNFIHVTKAQGQKHMEDISQYTLGKKEAVTLARHAKHAEYFESDKHWHLFDVQETTLTGRELQARHVDEMKWNVPLNTKMLVFSATEPEEMTLLSLHHYTTNLLSNHLAADRYLLSFWQRLFQPLASCVMMLLAIPFIFGPLRSATLGSRILAGASAGFAFHILNRFFGPISLVYQMPPLLAAVLPAMLFSVLALLMMRRVR